MEYYERAVNAGGRVMGTKVRSWPITEREGCAADDQTGTLYISEEKMGIWRVGAEPDAVVKGKLVYPLGSHGLTADVEGLTLLHGEGATDTDSIDVSPVDFGEKFPGGVFALHNGATPPFVIEVCDLRQLGLPLE